MDNSIDNKIVRVTDILEEVNELNKMIDLHKGKLGNPSMLSQYEYMKTEFVKELNSILQLFQLQLQTL